MAPTLIGRERPLELVQAEVNRTLDSHGGLVLVTGEAGVGKTTLVTRALSEASSRGALIASGACWEHEGAPGYWPWVQVLRSVQRELGPEGWASATEAVGEGLTYLLGDFTVPPTSAEFSDAAFQLFDSVTSLLATVAREQALVIALDDLHWADPASLQLLDFVVRHTWFERVLLVGTYRDVEVETSGHPLRDCLRPLEMKATAVTLTGLDVSAVAGVITQITGSAPTEEYAVEIHHRTGGNPLFVEQMARLSQAGGQLDVVAPGLRDAVHRHLSYLPRPILNVLTDAAVLGPEFHRQTLAAVAGLPAAEVRQLLDEATVTRLVVPMGSGRFAFAHDLVRQTLHDTLETAELRARHAAATRALKERPRDDTSASRLAHHAYLAVPEISEPAAIRYLLAAAREASCRLASEESATHYRRVLELIPADHPWRRAWVTFALADQQRRARKTDDARQTFEQAGVMAEKLDDAELRARVQHALAELAPPSDGPRIPAGEDGIGNVFRFDGSVWTLTFAGRTVHIPDAKGLHDLHFLLSRPGVDVPAVDLLTDGSDAEIRASRQLGGDDMLDDTAKAQYRHRLTQLDDEIERALGQHDDARAGELDRERAALLDELRAAAGLAGRTRRLGDEAERSRKTVTARIRDTLRRLADRHPELAEHLRSSVITGTQCQYRPAGEFSWEL
ncbi:ATP-binding protein [Phytoactinopolyspora mesophila]|uniref:ATP-binding protein n=1 Tax=Phytoactinopolyspora mesophila TaxID=2650750 RepID=UPI001C9E5F13